MLKVKQYIMKVVAVLLVAVLAVGTTGPVTKAKAAGKTVTVSTQAGLERALKRKDVTKIIIKTSLNKTFTISEGDYPGKAVEVNSSKAKINNYGKMESLHIKNAKKYMEYASGNTITVSAPKITIGVEKGAEVKNLTLKKTDASYNVVVRGSVEKIGVSKNLELNLTTHGEVAVMNVHTTAKITMSGKTESTTEINTAAAAKDVVIETSVPVDLKAKASVEVILNAGAEGSAVTAKTEEAKVAVENKTEEKIVIKDAEGTSTELEAGTKVDGEGNVSDVDKETGDETTDSGSNGGGTGGGTGGGIIVDPTPTPDPTPTAPTITSSYDGTKTTYTLTGADSFADLASAKIKVTVKDSTGTKAKTETVGKSNISEGRWTKLQKYFKNPEALAADWKAITDKTVEQNSAVVKVTGTAENMEKNVTVTYSGKQYTAVVTLADDGKSATIKTSAGGYQDKVVTVTKVSDTQFTVTGDTTDNLSFEAVSK